MALLAFGREAILKLVDALRGNRQPPVRRDPIGRLFKLKLSKKFKHDPSPHAADELITVQFDEEAKRHRRQSRAGTGLEIPAPVADGPVAMGTARIDCFVGKAVPGRANDARAVKKSTAFGRILRTIAGAAALIMPVPGWRRRGKSVAIRKKGECCSVLGRQLQSKLIGLKPLEGPTAAGGDLLERLEFGVECQLCNAGHGLNAGTGRDQLQ